MATVQVKKTKNYALFKKLKGNRDVDENHVEALIAAMKKKYIPMPIQVNGDMEVVDGQHRLEAAKRLGFEVLYLVNDEADIETVQALNSNSKNWSMTDYIKCYAELKKNEYVIFRDFLTEFELPVTSGIAICGLYGNRNIYKIIEAGNLRLPNINAAYELANKLKKMTPYYRGWKRRSFILAICRCMKKKSFSIDEFFQKLVMQSSKMKDCANVEQYVEVIEEIYNYKRSAKVNLRIKENAGL